MNAKLQNDMDPQSYKVFHESFMKNNNGSSIIEVFVTTVPSYFVAFLTVNLLTICTSKLEVPAQFLLEFFTMIFSVLLNVTVLNHRIWEIAGTLFIVTITSAGRQMYHRYHVLPFVIQIPAKRPDYIALLRGTINLSTGVCILAVDFQCFPRKLAKTETFGFGLMDMGVGLYVFCNGIVDAFSTHQRLTLTRFIQMVISTSPLLALGAARFFITNEIDYQQHVSEYGVHWNFFITLAFIKLLGTCLVSMLRKMEDSRYAALIVLICHQMALQLGLGRWVTSTEVQRSNFITANREGLISVPGYIGLYLACIYIGTLLKHVPVEIQEDETTAEPQLDGFITARHLLKKTLKVALHAMVLWKITYDCSNIFGVSRVLANMGYVLWVLSVATSLTVLFMLLEVFYYFLSFDKPRVPHQDTNEAEETSYCPIILNAINYNGLAFFVLANLLTGLVNLTFQTMLVNAAGCLFILTAYMFVLCSITTFLFVNKIKLKIWYFMVFQLMIFLYSIQVDLAFYLYLFIYLFNANQHVLTLLTKTY